MTSRRDRRDDEGFSWPPTQDDLDALKVLAFDDRADAVPAFWRAPRQPRARGEPSVDAPRGILPERPTLVPPSTSIANVPTPQPLRDRGRAWPAVPLDRLALLASGIVIGLALAVVVGLRQPSTAVVPPSQAAHPAAGGGIELPPIAATVRLSPPDTSVAASASAPPLAAPASSGGTFRAATLMAMPPSSPPSSPLRDAAPRRALVTPSPAARVAVTSAPGVRGPSVTPDAPATDGLADPARPDTATPADILEAVPGADIGAVSSSLPWAVREPTSSTAAPSAASSARPLIVDVLLRYQAAYSRMDVGAARAVWPSVDGRALERAFGTLQEQELALGACDISIDRNRATAVCPGTLRYRPKVGNTAPQRRNGRWEVQLDRGARGWAITGVNVR